MAMIEVMIEVLATASQENAMYGTGSACEPDQYSLTDSMTSSGGFGSQRSQPAHLYM